MRWYLGFIGRFSLLLLLGSLFSLIAVFACFEVVNTFAAVPPTDSRCGNSIYIGGSHSTVDGVTSSSCIEIELAGDDDTIWNVHAPKVSILDHGHTFVTRNVDGYADGEHNSPR